MENGLIVRDSLAETLDRINDALFFGRKISAAEKKEAALWIAGRQGGPKSYWGMFSPTKRDVDEGFRLFTGERVTSGAQVGHILGEESLRALALLGFKSAAVESACKNAAAGFARVLGIARPLGAYAKYGKTPGWFCCGTCTPVFWRNLAAGGLSDLMTYGEAEARISSGIKLLCEHRIRGGWRRFPFWFTVLALSGIDAVAMPSAARLARAEIGHAAPKLESALKKSAADDFTVRKKSIAARALAL